MNCVYCENNEEGDQKKIDLQAKRRDIPYAYNTATGEEIQTAVSVILPVFTCGECKQSWTDHTGEVIRDFAVAEARACL